MSPTASRALLPRIVRNLRPDRAWRILRGGRMSYLKYATNGMLGAEVYADLARRAATTEDLPFVEIGAAAGTGTIALAWGFAKAGHRSRIYSIERCEGGSRARFGGYQDNLEILERNLTRFGVRDRVELYTQDLTLPTANEFLSRLPGDTLAGFMHDADGRLDRDFAIFWPRTVAGGLIIVDDCIDSPDLAQLMAERGAGGRKYYVTAAGWQVILAAGLVSDVERLGSTVFARRAAGGRLDDALVGQIGRAADAAGEAFDQAADAA